MITINQRIADELAVAPRQVDAAVQLLDEGATVPFIARYRKEVTGGLDDTQMRELEVRLGYLRDLEDRRKTVLASIEEQGKLTDELAREIHAADTKSRLEDLYLPYKPKRRTKGQIAIEAGLEPLANRLFEHPELIPEEAAADFLNEEAGIATVKEALDGAKFILVERFAEDADLIQKLRNMLWQDGILESAVVAGKEAEAAKFSDYFEHREPLQKTPSHRALAMFRGRNEGFLTLAIRLSDDDAGDGAIAVVAQHWRIDVKGKPSERWMNEVVRWTWRVKLYIHLEADLMGQLRERAEADAIAVFASNLKDLLLAAPAGPRATIGLDPGLRTGVKVAVIDATGKVVAHDAVFPTPPQNRTREAAQTLLKYIREHQVELIAIGNGTASRETERFVADMLAEHPELSVKKVVVNESGASIYSASEYAAKELPNLDVTIRGAVSIARRLQDPLAELVKIEPKSIGVGQYQHDVSQLALSRSLDAVIEDCVNAVGVDLNTASSALLNRVSGLTATTAENVVRYREEHGVFTSRETLRKVPRIGDKSFEQAAGFLRIRDGDNPLDESGVHPEAYGVVDRIISHCGRDIRSLLGDSATLNALDAATFTDDHFGVPTVKDILAELEKPGRDPRPEFKTANFKDGIEKLSDLLPDMVLEGVITNVTNFGAFVDIGVHQDGLVHISALAEKFVKDPRDVVRAGDIVKVKVMDVDVARKRIALSMRMSDSAAEHQADAPKGGPKRTSKAAPKVSAGRGNKALTNNAFAAAFANAKRKK